MAAEHPAATKPPPAGGTFDVPTGGQSWFKRYRLPYLYILPAFIVLAVVTFYPIGYELYLSMTNFTIRSFRQGYDFIWFDNYVRILRGQIPIPNFSFWRVLSFNITWTVVNIVFHVLIGVSVAILLNRPRVIGRRVFRALFVIPWAMPPLVVSLIWNKMFNSQFGAINLSLKALGLPHDIRWLESLDAPIPFLPFLPLAFYAVAIANIWLGWPFMMVVATGALQAIPADLYEAARVDGASRWSQFRDITVPLIRPAMVPAIMYGTILTFNQFNVIYFITGGGPLGRTEILVTQAFKLVNPNGLYGVAAAFSVLVFLILLVITLGQNRVARGLEGWSDA